HGHRIGVGIAAGVVDEAGYLAEFRHARGVHALDVGDAANIAAVEMHAIAVGEASDERFTGRLIEVNDGDIGTFGERLFDYGSADASAPAGDENMPAVQS